MDRDHLSGGLKIPSLQELHTRIKNSDLNNSNFLGKDSQGDEQLDVQKKNNKPDSHSNLSKPIAAAASSSPSRSIPDSERKEREEYDRLMKEVRLFKQRYQVDNERNRQTSKPHDQSTGEGLQSTSNPLIGHANNRQLTDEFDDLESSTDRQKASQLTETVSDSPK